MDGIDQDRLFLEDLCKWSGLSPSRLGEEAGLSPTTITRTTSGAATSRLSTPSIEKLKNRFPDFPGWDAKALADRRLAFHGVVPEPEPDIVEIAEIDLRYGMGGTYLDGPVSTETRPFSREWLRNFTHSPPELLFWALGDGDSMEPTIRSGEVILIDRSERSPRMGDGIWAIAWGDIGMIKRLRPLPDGTVEIHSDNPLVRPGLATDGDLHVIGRVVAVVRRL